MRIEAKLTGLDELKDIIQSNIKDSCRSRKRGCRVRKAEWRVYEPHVQSS